jgi:prephenate dehydratase
MKIAFQGRQGAYSEMALHEHFGKAVDTVGCDAFDDVFDLVNKGEVTFGFIPVENTIAGTVVENYDLLFANDLFVIAEAYLPIRHTLLAKKEHGSKTSKRPFPTPMRSSSARRT